MAKKKKLLGLDALTRGNLLLDMGVPMTKVYKELGLDNHWSYPSTIDLFRVDRAGNQEQTRPKWLKAEPLLQEAPDDWEYEGLFPYGKWIKV